MHLSSLSCSYLCKHALVLIKWKIVSSTRISVKLHLNVIDVNYGHVPSLLFFPVCLAALSWSLASYKGGISGLSLIWHRLYT